MSGRAQGFSFVEALVGMLVFVVVMSIAFAFLVDFGATMNTESDTLAVQQSVRVALDETSRNVRQTGYRIERPDPFNPADWQRSLVHAGAHVLVFNADIDPNRGAIPSSVSVALPGGAAYVGEASGSSLDGAETYVYTVDGNGNGTLESADRSQAASGNYNPAAETENPLDFALLRRVYGYDGSGYGGTLEPLVPFLFTNATSDATYPGGDQPDPLFTYWLTEDLDLDGKLDDEECVNDVVDTCPPATPRDPLLYLWGDTNFDGALSESEKTALRSIEVGSTGWSKNNLLDGSSYKSTTLSAAIDPSSETAYRIELSDATKIGAGYHVRIGSGGSAELFLVERVGSGGPNHVVLSSDPANAHAVGETVAVLPSTLLSAVRAVEIRFTSISGTRDTEGGARRAGRAGRMGDFGTDYRVTPFKRTVELLNATVSAVGG